MGTKETLASKWKEKLSRLAGRGSGKLRPLSVREFAVLTHPGLKRFQNEDSVLVRPDLGLFVVADGMGGHSCGLQASTLAMEQIEAYMADYLVGRERVSGEEADAALTNAVERAHKSIRQFVAEKAPGLTVGTTVAVVLVQEENVRVAHVGDSRLYRYSNGKLHQMTTDHNMFRDLVEMGRLTDEEGGESPFAQTLSRALGVQQAHQPDVQSIDSKAGDIFILCTDGVHNVIENGVLELLVGDFESKGLEPLAEIILSEVLVRGGPDNVSLVLVRV
ncbi:MAG: serine/threonine-protein phosphatase [Gammaproteobacteria bacterium]|nr:serine/threonine-protein phosphatase [Gammaproteobacteria bacterium]